MTLYLPHRHTDNCPTEPVTQAAPLWTCGCRQSSRHGPCSSSHQSWQKAPKHSLPVAVPSPASTTHRSKWDRGPRQGRVASPVSSGQGEKGKGSPSLPSPTPVRGHGGLNPSLASNRRGLLPCTATIFKITSSDFSQSPQTQQEWVGREG